MTSGHNDLEAAAPYLSQTSEEHIFFRPIYLVVTVQFAAAALGSFLVLKFYPSYLPQDGWGRLSLSLVAAAYLIDYIAFTCLPKQLRRPIDWVILALFSALLCTAGIVASSDAFLHAKQYSKLPQHFLLTSTTLLLVLTLFTYQTIISLISFEMFGVGVVGSIFASYFWKHTSTGVSLLECLHAASISLIVCIYLIMETHILAYRSRRLKYCYSSASWVLLLWIDFPVIFLQILRLLREISRD